MKRSAVIVAGGESSRFEKNKLFASLFGKTLIEITVGNFIGIADEIVLVVNPKDMQRMTLLFCGTGVKLTTGGHTRAQSVMCGLRALSADSGVVAIHDGARPYASRKLIEQCFAEAEKNGSAVPVVSAVDTVYIKEGDEVKFVDKHKICNVQTPQAFITGRIKEAYDHRDEAAAYTDDSQVYMHRFGKIRFIQGETTNVKITYPTDLYGTAIGSGYDAHRLAGGRKLVLCGVEIPFEQGLDGHSDADVAAHAIMDAVLAAIGERDIGTQFPDTDMQYKDASSMLLMRRVAKMAADKKAAPQSVSCVIIAQKPKLADYIPQMAKNVADALGIPESRVSVSATTTENLGVTAEGKGIAAQATCQVMFY